jgi:DNA-binding response OmpR family regulator
LRARGIEIPILMLTARSEEIDKVVGLEVGADDYVTKPFSIKELLARVEAFLRRQRKQTGAVVTFGDCRLDITARRLLRAGKDVPLSPKEFELLAFLADNSGRALSRDRIMSSVWGYDCRVTPRSIDRFVNALRNKIEADPAQPRFLTTVREFGYKFEFLEASPP